MKNKPKISGYSQNGTLIIDGITIFKLMDSTGFPLYLINELLKTHGYGFNILEFVQEAKRSGNYNNKERLKLLFTDDKEETKKIVFRLIDKIYD